VSRRIDLMFSNRALAGIMVADPIQVA